MHTVDELLEQTKNPDPTVRDLAVFNLYARADRAEKLLAEYRDTDARRRERAELAVVALGRLLRDLPAGRKSVPVEVVRDIWRDACQG